MSDSVSVRELRNTVSAVLRRVEAGERVTVTVDRRPVAELTVGVLVASDNQRPGRVARLSAVESARDPLPVTGEVAREFARIVADLRAKRRRLPVLDALIAATAIV